MSALDRTLGGRVLGFDLSAEVDAGHLVALPARQRHAVTAADDAAFLLTVVMPGSGA